MDGGHGFHCRPRNGVFSLFELLHAIRVALSTGFRRGNFRFCGILRRCVIAAVTRLAPDAQARMLAQFPVIDDIRRGFGVTFHTLFTGRTCHRCATPLGSRSSGSQQSEEK
jgi:hypothetical protein